MKATWVLVVATLTTAAALGGGAASASPSFECPTASTVVDINLSYGFNPRAVEIFAGTTVCWRNNDGWSHTATSDTAAFDSGRIIPSRSYSFTFNTPGSFAYHNALYPWMTGTVEVTEGEPRCPSGAAVVDILAEFDPATVDAVVPDTTVCWRNRDDRKHRVASDTGAFESGDIVPGGTYSFTFNTTGSHAYHEPLYPWMTGTVGVARRPLPPWPQPCSGSATSFVSVNRGYGYRPARLNVFTGTTAG